MEMSTIQIAIMLGVKAGIAYSIFGCTLNTWIAGKSAVLLTCAIPEQLDDSDAV